MNQLALGTVQFGLDYGISNSHGQVIANEVKQIQPKNHQLKTQQNHIKVHSLQ